MSQQSFHRVFVSNTPTLLASGSTVENIAVGQIGILDAKTNKAVTAPTYANNKAIKFVQGTADNSDLPITFGAANQNLYTKLIKGKDIKAFKGKAARRGQNEIWTLGWNGDAADTRTLGIKPGETKQFAVTLTGGFIEKLYSPQGYTRKFQITAPAGTDCADPCVSIDCNVILDDVLKQVSADKDLKKFLRVGKMISCNPSLSAGTTDTDYSFQVTIVDSKDQAALAAVQAQYPNDKVTRVASSDLTSTYRLVRDANTTPTGVTTSIPLIINDCDTCPTGYTLIPSAFAYKIQRNDAGTAGAKTQVNTDYSLGGSEINNRVNYEYGLSTYVVTSTTQLTAVTGDVLTYLGKAKSSCVISSATTVAWTASGNLTKYSRSYEISLNDSVCGTDRLTALQAAYPALTIALKSGSTGPCVHTYTTSVFSDPLDAANCSLELANFTKPTSFEGTHWVEVPASAVADGTVCKCGLRFEVAVVNRKTNECTFDYFPADFDTVHLQISEFNEDYTTVDAAFADRWVGRKIRSYVRPVGSGEFIRKMEWDTLMYDRRFRSIDPVVREIEQYEFQAKQGKYYDEYQLWFSYDYPVGGFSQRYVDNYIQYFYVPEGQGKALEVAINGYLASANIAIEPVEL